MLGSVIGLPSGMTVVPICPLHNKRPRLSIHPATDSYSCIVVDGKEDVQRGDTTIVATEELRAGTPMDVLPKGK